MHPNLATYFGILHRLHNIFDIFTMIVYFIVNQSENTQSIDFSKTALQAYYMDE